mmetsp:Transcript_7085/g.17469  ORF Transcript_7085/g.17469 Transcript_7085/m.17469 type:complete len:231 (-) Transcript_7085:205-897(-)
MQSLSMNKTIGSSRFAKASSRSASATHVARARKALWYPGDDAPEYLDGSIPGDYGFDPFSLGKDKKNLERFRESEVIHGRWAMLGSLGCLAVEASGNGSWLEAPKWAIEGADPSYLGQSFPSGLPLILGIQFVAMAGSEAFRQRETDPMKRIYPGGSFDPLGYGKNADAAKLEELKTKEIKNGRLAMFSMAGYYAQGLAVGKGPIACLQEHAADPFHVNIATNGVSVPIY